MIFKKIVGYSEMEGILASKKHWHPKFLNIVITFFYKKNFGYFSLNFKKGEVGKKLHFYDVT